MFFPLSLLAEDLRSVSFSDLSPAEQRDCVGYLRTRVAVIEGECHQFRIPSASEAGTSAPGTPAGPREVIKRKLYTSSNQLIFFKPYMKLEQRVRADSFEVMCYNEQKDVGGSYGAKFLLRTPHNPFTRSDMVEDVFLLSGDVIEIMMPNQRMSTIRSVTLLSPQAITKETFLAHLNSGNFFIWRKGEDNSSQGERIKLVQ